MTKAKVRYLPVKIKGRPGFKMAYWDIDSGKEGPCLLVTAALHGNEVQGSEVIRRFCPVAEKSIIRGRMILVPFVNLPALWNRRPHIISTLAEPRGQLEKKKVKNKVVLMPKDPMVNINRTWPGDPRGNESQQLACIIFKGIFEQATHNIDLHCYNRFTGAAAIPEGCEKAVNFAKLSAFPFLRQSAKPLDLSKEFKGTAPLSDWFNLNGRTAFTVEFSGQYVVLEKQVRIGVRALTNCSKHLGMFRGKPEGLEETVVIEQNLLKMVTAPFGGLFIENGLTAGDFVKKGSVIGWLFSDRSLKTKEIKAPVDGYLYAYGHRKPLCDVDLAAMHPYADRGDNLAVIVKSSQKR